MNVSKSMIEIVKIDGLDVAIERQSGNCKVNLTNMAKRYGKEVYDWTKTKEARAFLAALEMLNQGRDSGLASDKSVPNIIGTQSSNFEQDESVAWIHATKSVRQNWRTEIPNLIITRKGGSAKEQGTWCTDYRIAIRFAMWLDPLFAVFVIDTFMRIMSGERIVSEDGFFSLGGKQWVSCFDYCKMLHRSAHSFYGLKGHYPKDFIFWDGQWYISRDLFNMKELQARYENRRLDMRSKYDDTQLAIPFESETIQEG